jgi:YidC/Oxa1 family membrane protein insertase
MSEQKNLILAVVLSLIVLLVYQELVIGPQMEEAERLAAEQAEQAFQSMDTGQSMNAGEAGGMPQLSGEIPAVRGGVSTPSAPPVTEAEPSPRLRIETPSLSGSIALRGARIDDLVLIKYFDQIGPEAQNIVLLKNSTGTEGYYVAFGWSSLPNSGLRLPDKDSLWTSESTVLTPQSPATLMWSNGEGLLFVRTISVDDDYAFTITDRVENRTGAGVAMAPYGAITRKTTPATSGFAILHEGALGVLGGELQEKDYGDLQDERNITYQSVGGWMGITDKYWLTALIPDQALELDSHFTHNISGGVDVYQVNYILDLMSVPAGGAGEVTSHFFAGAKNVDLIESYEIEFGAALFDRAIDWGWLYFLTKPIFFALQFFYGLVGNFGIAILLLTVVIKGLFYPLANKQYVSMSKMKKLQPKVAELRERYKDDKVKLQQETMALYKKEQVNPLAGCLPILLQIPVFFALYKVLFVSIEMRHTPFFGWIKDLSAPDPLTPINLFGLIPWDPPGMIAIGIWPILMGLTMWLQMRLNPQQPDPIQAKIFMFMPIFFTFILAQFAVGLVIYWTWNNLLSIAQQWSIMRRMGVSAGNDNKP